MDDATKNLEIFSLALPDANLLLFDQTPNQLDTFTCFGKLPIELRTVIWRFSFSRRRKVYVRNRVYIDEFDIEYNSRLLFSSHHQPPRTFWVNRESRAVSLKDYRILLQDTNDPTRKIYFHPVLDILVLPDISILEDGRMFPKVSSRLLAIFSEVQSLELHNMWWSSIRTDIIGLNSEVRGDDWDGEYNIQQEREDVVPGHFRALHELFLVGDDGFYDVDYDPRAKRECMNSLQHFFTTKAEADTEFKIPKITLIVPDLPNEEGESDGGSDDGFENGSED